jgi:hypothetical protein
MPVPPAVHRDMAMFLDRWSFADRVFLQGAELSGWEIKRTPAADGFCSSRDQSRLTSYHR